MIFLSDVSGLRTLTLCVNRSALEAAQRSILVELVGVGLGSSDVDFVRQPLRLGSSTVEYSCRTSRCRLSTDVVTI